MSAAGWLWIAAAATALGSLLSALFHSLKDMTRSEVEQRARAKGSTSDLIRVERILDDPGGHSTAVALPRIVCNMLVAVAAVGYVDAVGAQAMPLWAEIALGVGASSILVWIFGLVIPHAVASYAAEATVLAWAWLIRLCWHAQRPLALVVGFLDEVVRRLAGKPRRTQAEQLEAELMSVVDEAQEEGQFDDAERDMIKAVVGFRNTTVEQIMTPRTEIEAMALSNNLGEVIRFIKQTRHSRIPVYEGSLDHVVGMFYVKDLMRWLAGDGARTAGKPFELKSILRPAYFVPETKTIRELLQELLDKKVHAAMVADEYGGTSGMVSLEDIVEEIFGEIQDEYEKAEDEGPEIEVKPESGMAEVDARAYIDDANEALASIGLRLPESEDYDTVGGMIITRLGRIPSAGETVRITLEDADGGASADEGEVVATILEAEPTRVVRVKIERPEPMRRASGEVADASAEDEGADESVESADAAERTSGSGPASGAGDRQPGGSDPIDPAREPVHRG